MEIYPNLPKGSSPEAVREAQPQPGGLDTKPDTSGPGQEKPCPVPPALQRTRAALLCALCCSPFPTPSEEATGSRQARLEPGSSFLNYTLGNWEPVSLPEELPRLLPGLEGLMPQSASHDGLCFQGLRGKPQNCPRGGCLKEV